ncbi:MAG: lysine--tRNA ligase [Pyrinomonadaceae bacterium]
MSIANTQAETIIEEGIIDDNDQTRARVENLRRIEAVIGNSYPNKFERSRISGAEDTISNVLSFEALAPVVKEIKAHIATLAEKERPAPELKEKLNAQLKEFGNVRIAGRLTTPPRGNFVHLTDGRAKLQIYSKKGAFALIKNDGENTPDTENAWTIYSLLDHGDFVGVEGYLFLTNTGELSVHVETLQFLSKSLLPMPDKMHGIADPELRRRFRYADLIASSLQVEHEGLTTREVFERRARLISGMRNYLDAHGYIEVETPMLTPKATGAAATPFETHHNALDITLYARIAPELYLKRLVVGGFEKVYELNRNFRNEGLSFKHNPEFTMLEFYCAYMDVNGMMDFAEAMIKESVQKATGGSLQVKYGENEIDFSKFERISMKEAITKQKQIAEKLPQNANIETLNWANDKIFVCALNKFLKSKNSYLDARENNVIFVGENEKGELETSNYLHQNHDKDEIEKLRARGDTEHKMGKDKFSGEVSAANWNSAVEYFEENRPTESDYSKAVAEIFESEVEKNLINPTFIIDYPKIISPLSKASPANPNIAERFELFINGMECANGFSELNDPQEQFERFLDQMKEREGGDVEAMVLDEDYIRALSYGMPPAAGIGIGIDRLTMLLTNKHSIRDVILFPHMRPEKKDAETEI